VLHQQIDSLKQVLTQQDQLPDSSRYQVLYEIAKAYNQAFELDSALVYQNILLQSDQQLDDRLLSSVYLEKGKTLYYRGDFEAAILSFEKVLKSKPNPAVEMKCFQSIASAYIELGDLNKGLANAQQSLNLAQELEDQNGIIGNLNNIGNIYYDND